MEHLHNQIDDMVTTELGPTELGPTELDTVQPGMQVSQYQENRLRRMCDYQADVLKKESHFEAVLGTVNAGLMGVAIQMDNLRVQVP